MQCVMNSHVLTCFWADGLVESPYGVAQPPVLRYKCGNARWKPDEGAIAMFIPSSFR